VINFKVINRTRRATLTGLCIAILLCLMGCAVGPDFVRPEAPKVDRYTRDGGPAKTVTADGKTQRFEQGAKIAADWWRLFNSTKLEMAIKEAMANNQSLQSAQASLRQSQENLRAGYGVFYPGVDAGFDASRHKVSQARFTGGSGSTIFNLYTLTATVSYVLDIFGGERRAVESLKAQVDFQHYAVLATYLALTGNVVNTVIARASYTEEINATEQMIAFLKEQVALTEIQARAGIVPYSNVLSLRSQLASTEALLPLLRQKLVQTEHLLATLSGRTPAEWMPLQIAFADLTLPGNLPVSLPSDLVRQRPDILAAEAQLHSASAQIGVATAALYPSFTLTGDYGQNSTSVENLLKNSNSIWSIGADIAAPLFHGGTLRAKRQAAVEAYNQSLSDYRQTVLSSFAQVADVLRAIEHDAEALHAQSQALKAEEETLRIVEANYQAGIANYLQVLVADNQLYQAKISYIQAQAQRFQDTVALFVALGGGWWDADEAVPAKPKD
jgi:NodT family efflux transporter outer membrane factor (OMF) lipoprotein